MENKKKNLAKVAVAALLLAASLPAASHADETESQGILLAANCGNRGSCGAASSQQYSGNTQQAMYSGNPQTNQALRGQASGPGVDYGELDDSYGQYEGAPNAGSYRGPQGRPFMGEGNQGGGAQPMTNQRRGSYTPNASR